MEKDNIKIEFVRYSGSYPNLCCGTLVLKINEKEVIFPYGSLISGGTIITDPYESIVEGKWDIRLSKEMKELELYRKEILDCINENIPYGCCGGCI